VKDHLDWRSRKRSPFISVYDTLERAQYEARRRVRHNSSDVVIWEIKTTSKGKRRRGRKDWPRAEYRNLTKYAEKRGFDIPKVALNMSEHEWLFLKSIPECMIVRRRRISLGS
jgi:serine/threonine-protein kinase RIO1